MKGILKDTEKAVTPIDHKKSVRFALPQNTFQGVAPFLNCFFIQRPEEASFVAATNTEQSGKCKKRSAFLEQILATRLAITGKPLPDPNYRDSSAFRHINNAPGQGHNEPGF